MIKPLFVISSPFDTYSGYGARSRDLIKSIIKSNKYKVQLISQRWGSTPFGFCKDHPEFAYLMDYVVVGDVKKKPDVWAQVTVPNEFQSVGKLNIGFTAGMETTLVDATWVEGMNRMDVNFVSSEHSKKVFLGSVFDKMNEQTKQKVGVIKISKPIEVLFEGANLDTYFPITSKKEYESYKSPLIEDLNEIPEDFSYLMVGHWMQGDMGEDRKNVGLLIKAFYETFKNKKQKPALILKTSSSGASYTDRDQILKKITKLKKSVASKDLPNVYLLHGELSDVEMNLLYNHPKVKSMVSLTKGEGFGRPLLEFSLSKKPIIATGYSGHLDFLNPNFNVILKGTLKNVHPSAVVPNMILAESQWFNPDHGHIGASLRDVFENYKNYKDLGKRQAHRSKTEFSWEVMHQKFDKLLTEYISKIPKEVPLNLPKMNLPKLKLPKKK
tara:strand:+ start:528 stop:1847 length:1320 start_codon:yes stop_codon:yes gene_type:complete